MRVFRVGLLGLCALSGCATWVEGSRQLITVTTPPTQAAYCILTRPGSRWTVTTPGTLRVDKSSDDIAIRCSRPGFQDAQAVIPSEIEGWTFGNLAFGGVTAGIDATTGAMFAYPNDVALPMTPLGSAAPLPRLVPPEPSAAPAEPAAPSQPPLPGTLPAEF